MARASTSPSWSTRASCSSSARSTSKSALAEVDPKALRGELLTDAGATYDQSQMDKTVERLTLVVSEQGFAFARVRPRAARDAPGALINVTYVIDEGPRIYIERINIIGNLRTQDYVIRREFRLAEGDAYNPLMVDKAKKRLQELGFFKTVEIKRRPGSAPDRVILDVELVEQSTGELSFGAGYSTSEGVIGDVSITERNLLGRGQFLRLRLAGSAERLQVDLSFTEPRFLDRNLAAGFDLFHKDVDLSSVPAVPHPYDRRLGAPRLPDHGESVADQQLHARPTTRSPTWQPTASLAIKEAQGEAYRPPRGARACPTIRATIPRTRPGAYYLQVGTEFAGLGGDVQYVRASAEGRFYYPITDKITFVGRAMGGHIEGWGGQDVRLIDLFYKGGETIRGFDRGGFGPRDLLTSDALGGSTFWSATAEVRFPIPFIPRGPRHERRGLRRRRLAVRRRRRRQEARHAVRPAVTRIPTGAVPIPASAWPTPARARLGGCQHHLGTRRSGPLRLDIAKALIKEATTRSS